MIGGPKKRHQHSQGYNVSHLKQLKTKYEKKIACMKHGRLMDVLLAFIAGLIIMFWILQMWYCD